MANKLYCDCPPQSSAVQRDAEALYHSTVLRATLRVARCDDRVCVVPAVVMLTVKMENGEWSSFDLTFMN